MSNNDVRNNAFQGIDVQAGVNGLTIWTGNISSNTTINNGHAAPDPANGNGIILWDVGTAGGLLQLNGSFTENLSDQNAGYGIRTIIANPASTFLIGPFNGNLFGTQANGLGNTEHTDTIGKP